MHVTVTFSVKSLVIKSKVKKYFTILLEDIDGISLNKKCTKIPLKPQVTTFLNKKVKFYSEKYFSAGSFLQTAGWSGGQMRSTE